MSVSPAKSIDDLREKIKSNQNSDITKPDDSRVVIAEMQLNALLKMSDDTNEIFSQVHKDEVFDISRAIVFSRSCLPSVSERMKSHGAEHIFTLPILETFIRENFRHLHKADRARVSEYLQGLQNISREAQPQLSDVQKQSLLKRLV